MIKSILTQTKIMLNKKGFMFGFSAMMMICLLEVVFSSYGVTALRMEGDGFPGNDPSSVITSFEAFILCVPSGLLSYLELLFPFLCALPFSFRLSHTVINPANRFPTPIHSSFHAIRCIYYLFHASHNQEQGCKNHQQPYTTYHSHFYRAASSQLKVF